MDDTLIILKDTTFEPHINSTLELVTEGLLSELIAKVNIKIDIKVKGVVVETLNAEIFAKIAMEDPDIKLGLEEQKLEIEKLSS